MLKRPQIKFYKDAVSDILAGKKRLEPRPRSLQWIRKIRNAEFVDLTYGPRIGSPITFATARICKVEIRPFESATEADLKDIALGWEHRAVSDFVAEYVRWFLKDLDKGYSVAWIYFEVTDIHLRVPRTK